MLDQSLRAKKYQQQNRKAMISLTSMVEGGVFATEGSRQEELVFEARGLIGYILKKLLLLGPGGEIVESNGAFGPLPRRSLF